MAGTSPAMTIRRVNRSGPAQEPINEIHGGSAMNRKHRYSIKAALLGGVVMAAWPALAAEVTPQRLANPEPRNWLMNHRTYDGQRFSPPDRINKENVKNLKLPYAAGRGGTPGRPDLAPPRVAW